MSGAPGNSIAKRPLICAECNAILLTINYEIWGIKKFNSETCNYIDDKTWGSTEMHLSCPVCSATLDPDPAIDFLQV